MINYDKQMQKIIAGFSGKPKLLLHACCAPCSTAAIDKLIDFFDITVYFYNPNIDTEKEYFTRAEEEKRYCKNFDIPVVVKPYNPSEFYQAVKGYELYPEGGARCELCFKLRLFNAANYAKENGFDYFTTTLTLSPLKNAELLNKIGFDAENEYKVKFLPSDFKKRDGFLKSVKLSEKFGLYRQNYCGCAFSKNKNPV
ncbi:MAG: epoxyqueuosine reductase QueH [Clostridia bacterium]|nr:epoxyqueuosine reductase QueH [Clostridia bacterium]